MAVSAFEWGYEPETITVAQGEAIRIEFTNDGRMTHNLKIDDLDAEAVESENDELFVEADNGESATLTFTPTEAGDFEFYCTISGHRGQGMEGTLMVGAADVS